VERRGRREQLDKWEIIKQVGRRGLYGAPQWTTENEVWEMFPSGGGKG